MIELALQGDPGCFSGHEHGGPAGASVVGSLAGTKALANARAYQNVLSNVKQEQGFIFT